ncbi:MAG: DDE-type integrase/transposase/recombinase [Elusimicrobia bacterium]|nr:DDE-type integrase/transposase/recombinase [Elusimicrobiota bacterium]
MARECHKWPLEAKLEAVRARQRGLSVEEVSRLTGLSATIINESLRIYRKYGVAGLQAGRRREAPARKSAKLIAAEQALSQLGPMPEGTGIGKVQGLLYRLGFLKVSRNTAARAAQAQVPQAPKRRRRRRNKPVQVRSFERAKPNELWQTDIMTFMLKGQYRLYLMGFMDDNSRFLVGWGLFRYQTTKHVQEVFRAAIEKHGLPKEVLSDNGRQYYSWRGKSQFTDMLRKLGIAHIRSRPYHPQTLGKIESFWRNMWQECLSAVPLSSFEEAEQNIREYVEHYNFRRPHQGIGNLVPADRFFKAAKQVTELVAENTAKVEEQKPPLGDYKLPTYLVGNIGGKELRMVAQSAEVSLRDVAVEKVELPGEVKATGEVGDGRTEAKQAAEPPGAAGADPAGACAAGVCGGAVQAGGCRRRTTTGAPPQAAVGPVERATYAGSDGHGRRPRDA